MIFVGLIDARQLLLTRVNISAVDSDDQRCLGSGDSFKSVIPSFAVSDRVSTLVRSRARETRISGFISGIWNFLKGFGTQRDLINKGALLQREKYEDDNESWIDDSPSGRFHSKQPSGNRCRAARFLESPRTFATRSLVCEEYN